MTSHMTWVEVEEKIKQKACALVPLGATEAQSLHNPMGLDYMLSTKVAEAVAEKINAVVIPPLPFGDSCTFRGFPGAIPLRPSTMEAVLYDELTALIRSGFENIVVINNHTPNRECLEHVMVQIREEYGYCIPSIFPALLAQAFCKKEELIKDPNPYTYRHGSIVGTSLMYYLFPDDVRVDLMKDNRSDYGRAGCLKIANAHGISFQGQVIPLHGMMIKDRIPNGGTGEPRADAELGKEIFDRIVGFTTDFVSDFMKEGCKLMSRKED